MINEEIWEIFRLRNDLPDECFISEGYGFYDKLEEFMNIKKAREMLSVQGDSGNWNYDPYMHGMYNGMEYMLSLIENREPIFKSAPGKWLKDIDLPRDIKSHKSILIRVKERGDE